MAKILSVVNTAYRATLEEQDDTVLWFTSACKGAGGDLTVLLGGSAVNYAVMTQNPTPLRFGAAGIEYPPRLHEDLKKMMAKGISVFMVRDDAEERGIDLRALLPGVEPLSRSRLAQFMRQYDQVWNW